MVIGNLHAVSNYYSFYKELSDRKILKTKIFKYANYCKRGNGQSVKTNSGLIDWMSSPYVALVKVNNKRSHPVPVFGFVYLLLKDREILYIGQTCNPRDRIAAHSKKDYNKILFLPCVLNNMRELEIRLIRHFRPRLNKTDNPDWLAKQSWYNPQITQL